MRPDYCDHVFYTFCLVTVALSYVTFVGSLLLELCLRFGSRRRQQTPSGEGQVEVPRAPPAAPPMGVQLLPSQTAVEPQTTMSSISQKHGHRKRRHRPKPETRRKPV
ncbi:hypothetical protein chiPu_0028660 [Chiloscyllium punctatum]|uniref:Uncharacterized protein n=2 Tax=Chiloscyllium punctatum TaxID=137246 RepID=A0A401TP11_CHIPU|nr:hypothetical protein [Chiloscyllium punctatum]